MNLDELDTFLQVAELGGFTQASRALGRSQPAISRRIRQLEDFLGAPLFERTGRTALLSGAGLALLPHAEAALAAARDGERAVRELATTASGARTLNVAIVGTLADSHLVGVLRSFKSRFGDASIELRTGTSREVSALVRSGAADVGLRYFRDDHPRLDSTPLGSERLFVVVPAEHRIGDARVTDLRAFAGDGWVGFPPEPRQPESYGSLLEQVLASSGLDDPTITIVDSLTAQKRLVEAGLGVALMAQSAVREELRIGSLRAVEIDDLDAKLPVVVLRRRGGHESLLSGSFVELLQEPGQGAYQ